MNGRGGVCFTPGARPIILRKMKTDKQTNTMSEAGGVLVVDKPESLTSHDVVARVRRLFGTKRVGHTGTLDPFATGVLVVLVGRATRLAQFLSGAEKEYEALIRFGYSTDTGDATGAREGSDDAITSSDFDAAELESALASLRGAQMQTPPMYSAKKIAGRKLYELARRGESVERAAVPVTISEFVTLSDDGKLFAQNADGTRDLRARVVCSAGTYIRVLAEDLGARLGAGAHLAQLRRTRAGAFALIHSATLDELQTLAGRDDRAALYDRIIPSVDVLPDMPAARLTHEQLARVSHGAPVRIDDSEIVCDETHDDSYVRLVAPAGHLVAVGTYDRRTSVVQPRVMLDIDAHGRSD